jgi:hypothetical protein
LTARQAIVLETFDPLTPGIADRAAARRSSALPGVASCPPGGAFPIAE